MPRGTLTIRSMETLLGRLRNTLDTDGIPNAILEKHNRYSRELSNEVLLTRMDLNHLGYCGFESTVNTLQVGHSAGGCAWLEEGIRTFFLKTDVEERVLATDITGTVLPVDPRTIFAAFKNSNEAEMGKYLQDLQRGFDRAATDQDLLKGIVQAGTDLRNGRYFRCYARGPIQDSGFPRDGWYYGDIRQNGMYDWIAAVGKDQLPPETLGVFRNATPRYTSLAQARLVVDERLKTGLLRIGIDPEELSPEELHKLVVEHLDPNPAVLHGIYQYAVSEETREIFSHNSHNNNVLSVISIGHLKELLLEGKVQIRDQWLTLKGATIF